MATMTNEELREKVARKLEANPGLKTAMMADALAVPETDILRAMPDGYATELDASRAEGVIRALEHLGTLYVVVRNSMTVSEVSGKFGGFGQSGPFFNVASEALHLHLKLAEVAAVFIVEAPSREEGGTPMVSVQFFDTSGASGLKAFVLPMLAERDGTDLSKRLDQMRDLRHTFPTPTGTAS